MKLKQKEKPKRAKNKNLLGTILAPIYVAAAPSLGNKPIECKSVNGDAFEDWAEVQFKAVDKITKLLKNEKKSG